jgi:hypothetical protein
MRNIPRIAHTFGGHNPEPSSPLIRVMSLILLHQVRLKGTHGATSEGGGSALINAPLHVTLRLNTSSIASRRETKFTIRDSSAPYHSDHTNQSAQTHRTQTYEDGRSPWIRRHASAPRERDHARCLWCSASDVSTSKSLLLSCLII